nr:MAG TPA: hypothetical protein [Caudoviricetes sp.]
MRDHAATRDRRASIAVAKAGCRGRGVRPRARGRGPDSLQRPERMPACGGSVWEAVQLDC